MTNQQQLISQAEQVLARSQRTLAGLERYDQQRQAQFDAAKKQEEEAEMKRLMSLTPMGRAALARMTAAAAGGNGNNGGDDDIDGEVDKDEYAKCMALARKMGRLK